MRLLTALVLLLLLLSTPVPALADGAPMMAVGPHLQPVESTTVRLERERIEIHLRQSTTNQVWFNFGGIADYRIQFHFVPSADETMTVGFPLFVIDTERHIYGAPLQNLKVSQNGREIATETQHGRYMGADTQWEIFPLTFKQGEPLDLEISYSLPVTPYGKTFAADLWIAYVLRTGAFWAGNIGRAEAMLTLDRPIRQADIRTEVRPDGRLGTTPGWRLVEGALHWEWRDVEPDFDLSLQLANTYWLDAPAQVRAMIAKNPTDRQSLLQIAGATSMLFVGDGRSGLWEQTREGSGEKVAEGFIADVLRLMKAYRAQHPEDQEFADRYFQLLAWSTWHSDPANPMLLMSESRFRTLLAEYGQYRKDGGRLVQAVRPIPWFPDDGYGLDFSKVKLSEAAQADAVAFLLADELPYLFQTEQAARAWAAKAGGGVLAAQHTDRLLAEALKLVRPPEPAAPAPAPAATAPAPATAPEPPPVAAAPAEAPARGFPWAPTVAVAGALVLVSLLFLRRRRA